MLILSRKIGESIIINGGIEIKVLDIQGNYMKLGIKAPKHIPVDRKEIHDRKTSADSETEDSESEDPTTTDKEEQS